MNVYKRIRTRNNELECVVYKTFKQIFNFQKWCI